MNVRSAYAVTREELCTAPAGFKRVTGRRLMDGRCDDAVRRRIDGWEAMRREFGANAPRALGDYIDREINKLRDEMTARDRPRLGGTRVPDSED